MRLHLPSVPSDGCLIVGHFDQSVDDLAKSLLPSSEVSGGYSVIRTNCVVADGLHLSYPDVFRRLSGLSQGAVTTLNPFEAPHAGVIYLVNRLRSAGLDADGLHYVSSTMAELTTALEAVNPRLVVLTTTFYVQDAPLCALVANIRATKPGVFIVIGGPYVSSRMLGSPAAAQQLAHLGADALIVDTQGEQSLIRLAQEVLSGREDELDDIPNLLLCEANALLLSTRREIEENSLEENRVLWNGFSGDLSPPVAFVRTARGCPFRCAFCNYPAMAGGLHHLSSVDSVCAELEELASLGVRHLAFVDDTFNVPLPRFKSLLAAIVDRDLGLRWTSFFRCSNADEECFDLMAKAGCQAVFLGIESGDPSILKAMNKAARPDAYSRGIAALTERGILTMASYVFGFPSETRDTVRRTLDFVADNPTTFFNVQLYYHDSLAPIERRREEFGIEGTAYAWAHSTMDWREASDLVSYAMSSDCGVLPLPLYSFSIWSLPYFEAIGFTREDFVGLAGLAADIFRASLTSSDELSLGPYVGSFEAIADRARSSTELNAPGIKA
jgi:radical SAM PhpK family P-methyltransferase